MKTTLSAQVVVVGAGHNGLVAATFLARAGLQVIVLEEKNKVGGAVKTEFPFAKAPLLGTSTGAYLLGVMPPELLTRLGIDMPLVRRDPHYFLPTETERYLLLARDIPGYDVRLTLRPAGTNPGEVIGDVQVSYTPVEVDVNVQNYGSKAVG